MDIVTNVERRLKESASLLIIMISPIYNIMKYKKEKRLENQKSSEHSKE